MDFELAKNDSVRKQKCLVDECTFSRSELIDGRCNRGYRTHILGGDIFKMWTEHASFNNYLYMVFVCARTCVYMSPCIYTTESGFLTESIATSLQQALPSFLSLFHTPSCHPQHLPYRWIMATKDSSLEH